jgi:hypothetical protein
MSNFFKFDKDNHPLAGTIVCKNDFFNNPQKIIELSKKQTYKNSERWPGKRTDNLLESTDPEIRDFAVFFAKKLGTEVFPGISRFNTHISFHINDVYDDEISNEGWIHNDDVTLAGLVYLTPNEANFNNGTSIFLKKGEQDFRNTDYRSRKDFNLTKIATEQYKKDLEMNHRNFEETVRFGNLFNRLIAYDSNLWHRPNNYKTNTTFPRTTLLFFIDFYEYEFPSLSVASKWVD